MPIIPGKSQVLRDFGIPHPVPEQTTEDLYSTCCRLCHSTRGASLHSLVCFHQLTDTSPGRWASVSQWQPGSLSSFSTRFHCYLQMGVFRAEGKLMLYGGQTGAVAIAVYL